MMIGTVLEPVTLSRAVPGGAESRFVRVRCGETLLTALDPLNTLPGEQVLLTTGQSAARFTQDLSVDAVVLGIVTEK